MFTKAPPTRWIVPPKQIPVTCSKCAHEWTVYSAENLKCPSCGHDMGPAAQALNRAAVRQNAQTHR